MATYFLSQNPTISNFGQDTNANDSFFIDTGPSSSLLISPSGANLVVTDGVHTAIFQNFSIAQFGQGQFGAAPFITNTFDGSIARIGDGLITAAADNNANNLAGGQKDDYLQGLGGADIISTGGGADRIFANQDDDQITINADPAGANLTNAVTVYGGQGNDNISGNSSSRAMLIFGNLGDDILSIGGNGNALTSTLYGGQGNDRIDAIGSQGANFLSGDIGNDLLTGGNGNDTIFGGNDNDQIDGRGGANALFGQQGDDNITMSGSADSAYGGQGRDIVQGSANADLIFGNIGSDNLNGNVGNDTIFGGQDNDVITGGAGADLMSGDIGNDYLVINIAANGAGDTGITQASADTVPGFQSSVDHLVLGTAGTTTNYTEVADASVVNVASAITAFQSSNASNPAPNFTYTFVAGQTSGYLVVDSNQDGAADGVVVLAGLNSTSSFDLADILAAVPANV